MASSAVFNHSQVVKNRKIYKMNEHSIDKIIEIVDDLPDKIPNISREFVEESRQYWAVMKKVFFDKAESPYYSVFGRFRGYDEYQQWYANKAHPYFAELNKGRNWPLKHMLKSLFRIYKSTADEKVITAFPLKTDGDQNICMVLPDNSMVVL
jgi:hypothetical protein